MLVLDKNVFKSKQDALAALETPGGLNQKNKTQSTPLSEMIGRNLQLALANSNRQNVAITASPQLKMVEKKTVSLLPALLFYVAV